MKLSDLNFTNTFFFIPPFILTLKGYHIFSIILFLAALFSTLYHESNQTRFVELDMVFASLSIFIILYLYLFICLKIYHPLSHQILLPLIFGILSLVVYFIKGDHHYDDLEYYSFYHSCWHMLAFISSLLVVLYTPMKKRVF
jgi:hypothetical protein